MKKTPEQRRKSLDRLFKVGIIGGTIVILGLAAPLLMAAFNAALALVGLGIVGSLVIAFAPVWSMKLANMRLKAIKYEAAQNPVPTLQNQLLERRRAQAAAKAKLDESAAALAMFKNKSSRLSQMHPAEAKEFAKTVALLEAAQKSKVQKWMRVDELNDAFEKEIEKASAIWDVTQSMIEAKRAMGVTLDIDPMEKIKAETAIDSIQLSLAHATSDLELSLAEEGVVIEGQATPMLEHNPGQVITPEILEKARVRK